VREGRTNLFDARRGGIVRWHVDCGKSLPFIFENPGKSCVKNSMIWPEALKTKPNDLISVQVHYGSTVEEDVAVISEFVRMQPKAIFVTHSGWARAASRAEEYAAKSAGGKMRQQRDASCPGAGALDGRI
jgi:hypothetical protein